MARTSLVNLKRSITLANLENSCVLEVLSLQITRNMDNFGAMRVGYVCSKKEQRVNLAVPGRIMDEVKDIPCVLFYTGMIRG